MMEEKYLCVLGHICPLTDFLYWHFKKTLYNSRVLYVTKQQMEKKILFCFDPLNINYTVHLYWHMNY